MTVNGAGLLLVNGRISDRAIHRYRRWRWFFDAVLSQVDLLLAQSESMRERFLSIGACAGRTAVGGNFKYDAAAAPIAGTSVAASTVAHAASPRLISIPHSHFLPTAIRSPFSLGIRA